MEPEAWSDSKEVYPLSTAMHSRCAECQPLQKAFYHQDDDMRVLGLQPLVLPLDLDTLLAMDDGIMNHPGELERVAFGGAAVQDSV